MTKTEKQFEVLNWASLFLKKHHCEPTIAEILLRHYLNVSRSQFYMMMQEPISNVTIQEFKKAVQRHVETGIPVQHLTGYEFFYGRKFFVNEHTLIPRPETEELVQHVIQIINQCTTQQNITIVDIGTGSGVIAVTLAQTISNLTVYATDISEKALHVAAKNAEHQHVTVNFLQGNYLQPLIDRGIKADIIISNPPYIAGSDKARLSRTVKDFDPNIALFAAENGLAAYKIILESSTEILNQDGMIFFEIGHDQGDAVYKLIKTNYPYSRVEIIQDINGHDRIVSARMNS